MAKKVSERGEAWMRILVGIVSGVILSIWKTLVIILAVVNWFVVLFSGKRDKGIAMFCEYWNSESYRYFKYLTGVTNERPFPFNEMVRLGKFEK